MENTDTTKWSICFFFFQAEDGIRDIGVTGVQTCALPIYCAGAQAVRPDGAPVARPAGPGARGPAAEPGRQGGQAPVAHRAVPRSEERRVGKECRSRW